MTTLGWVKSQIYITLAISINGRNLNQIVGYADLKTKILLLSHTNSRGQGKPPTLLAVSWSIILGIILGVGFRKLWLVHRKLVWIYWFQSTDLNLLISINCSLSTKGWAVVLSIAVMQMPNKHERTMNVYFYDALSSPNLINQCI